MAASNLDETLSFQPRFDAGGLIPAIVADAGDGARVKTIRFYDFARDNPRGLLAFDGLAFFRRVAIEQRRTGKDHRLAVLRNAINIPVRLVTHVSQKAGQD